LVKVMPKKFKGLNQKCVEWGLWQI